MYGELGAIKGLIDLSPEHALDEAEAFVASLGYSILRRTSTTLTVERRSSDQPAGQEIRGTWTSSQKRGFLAGRS